MCTSVGDIRTKDTAIRRHFNLAPNTTTYREFGIVRTVRTRHNNFEKYLIWQLILSFRWTAIGGCGEIASTHILFFRYLNRSYPCYSDNTMAPTQSPSVYGGICDYVKCTTESTPCQCDSSDCPNPLGLVVGCTKPIETCETKDVEPYLSTRIYDYGDVVVSSYWKSFFVVVFFASLILCYLSNSESAWIDTPA